MGEVGRIAQRAREEADNYREDNPQPLSGYVGAMGVYASAITLASVIAAATDRKLPARWSIQDLVTVALGTHKLSRTVSKASVTSPLRAPFTHYRGTGGPSELQEETRHSSQFRHSVGELLTCPFCLDVWVATAFVIGLVFAPRLTRLIAGGLASLAGADFLQLAYAMAQESAEK
jgi:hypothetical protein